MTRVVVLVAGTAIPESVRVAVLARVTQPTDRASRSAPAHASHLIIQQHNESLGTPDALAEERVRQSKL